MKSDDRRTATIGGWLAIGIGIGTALGVALDNVGVWIPIGLVLGLAIGAALNRTAGER